MKITQWQQGLYIVIGWWTGYKLGGALALLIAEYFDSMGVANYWQTTFLILGSYDFYEFMFNFY